MGSLRPERRAGGTMSKMWLFGTAIPLLIWGYVFVARAVRGWAKKRWGPCSCGGDCDALAFGAVWPVALPLWALVRFVLVPAWRATAFAEEWGAKFSKKVDDD